MSSLLIAHAEANVYTCMTTHLGQDTILKVYIIALTSTIKIVNNRVKFKVFFAMSVLFLGVTYSNF